MGPDILQSDEDGVEKVHSLAGGSVVFKRLDRMEFGGLDGRNHTRNHPYHGRAGESEDHGFDGDDRVVEITLGENNEVSSMTIDNRAVADDEVATLVASLQGAGEAF